jgi:CRP-like cAMP-binding protein
VPLLDGGKHLGTAVAITDVTLFSIERETFTDLCVKSPQLLAIVQGDCLSEVRNLINRLEIFAFRNVRERLAIALLNQAGLEQKNGRTSELRLTQQDLADLIGASRESVSRILKEFERTNIVTLGRGRIVLKDKQRLRRLVD